MIVLTTSLAIKFKSDNGDMSCSISPMSTSSTEMPKTELPKAGINTIIYTTMAIVGIAVATFIILNKKYKDIK